MSMSLPNLQYSPVVNERVVPDGFFRFPIHQKPLLNRSAEGDFTKIGDLFQLYPYPYALGPISSDTIWNDTAVILGWLL